MKPKYMTRFFILFFLITILFGSTANATTLVYSFTVESADTNPYGLVAGNTVTGYVTLDYNKGALDGTNTIHTYNDPYPANGDASDSAFSMSLIFGNKTYNQYDDNWWYGGDDSSTDDDGAWPAVTVDVNGLILSIDFNITDGTSLISIKIDNATNLLVLTASGNSNDGAPWSISGSFDGSTPIPEPATIFLLGLGLCGLAGLHRKRSLQ